MKTTILSKAILICLLFYTFNISAQDKQNLISNGGFEKRMKDWTALTESNGAFAIFKEETETVKEGEFSLRVAVKKLGDNPWDNQLIHKGWQPEKGQEYTLTFYAKTAKEDVSFKVVQQNSTYSEEIVTATPEWKKLKWTFTAQESFLQLKLHFNSLGTVYLDEISIEGEKKAEQAEARSTDTTTIDLASKQQQIEGFGSSLAFYENWITEHPHKEDLYKLAFDDLNLDWLRLRNDFKYQNSNEFAKYSKEFVAKAKEHRGDNIKVLMCAWTPPPKLKSNGKANNGTLKKENGKYVYDKYAQFWKDALVAYRENGVDPDWISIQNEPDYLTDDWETNKFTPQETDQYPGYDQAFDAVHSTLEGMPDMPEMLGSEIMGIGNNQFDKYHEPLQNKSGLHAYAYHLYNGGSPEFPDSYNAAFNNIKENYGERPNVMTEYEHNEAAWYKTSWLMNNALTEANCTAYFYWDLIWPQDPGAGLIHIDNPWETNKWKTEKGYQKTNHYYAFKHFSKFLSRGYTRVENNSANDAIKSSAYINADENELVLIMINTAEKEITSTLTGNKAMKPVQVVQSVKDDFFKELKGLSGKSKLKMPAHSVTTVIMKNK